jgi:hypothetical protein
MSRPLIISDCDEVLLHMIAPFRAWLDDVRGIILDIATPFEEAFRHKHASDPIERAVIGTLLSDFFATEMHRQYPVEGALDALRRLSDLADIVILTNLGDGLQQARSAQLAAHGITAPVHCNRGGKGPALARIVARYAPSCTLFIDDLHSNHASVAKHAPQVWRLHMVGEPELAPYIADSPDAHSRIDRWSEAEPWIMGRIAEAAPAH